MTKLYPFCAIIQINSCLFSFQQFLHWVLMGIIFFDKRRALEGSVDYKLTLVFFWTSFFEILWNRMFAKNISMVGSKGFLF